MMMLPPPAPTSAMSIAGVRRRYPPPLLSRLPREIGPPTSNSLDRRISYSSTTEALVVVPPISRLMTLARPSRRASAAAPITPAAGPDSISWTGRARARAAVMTPPFDCIVSKDALMSNLPSPVSSEDKYLSRIGIT